MSEAEHVKIVHFNDVYHLTDETLIARFASVVENSDILDPDSDTSSSSGPPLRIFSGDVFSPSLEAAVLRGEHMTSLLNTLNIDVACYGNHDFDFGEDRLRELSRLTNFPWTLTNAVQDGRLLAEAKPYVVKHVQGYIFGFFGLAGTDWPSNCQHLPVCDILDPVEIAKKTARQLRTIEHCDFVVALTHMRLPDDIEVAKATTSGVEKIDLFLGGHDHQVAFRSSSDFNADVEYAGYPSTSLGATAIHQGDVRIVKSGTNWRSLSVLGIEINPRCEGKPATISNMHLHQIFDLPSLSIYQNIPLHPKIPAVLAATRHHVSDLVTKPLFRTDESLDGRSDTVRSQETNLGNMLSDALRAYYDCDIALVNSGAIRCDSILSSTEAKPLCVRDAISIHPFDNAYVVKKVTGSQLLQAFENSVSDDHVDGRFLQVSGLRVSFSWDCPSGQRIRNISIADASSNIAEISSDKTYTVAMADFIATGFDGYACFLDAPSVVGAEGAITDSKLLLEIFSINNEDEEPSAGIARARELLICRIDKDALPVVRPCVDGRITAVSEA